MSVSDMFALPMRKRKSVVPFSGHSSLQRQHRLQGGRVLPPEALVQPILLRQKGQRRQGVLEQAAQCDGELGQVPGHLSVHREARMQIPGANPRSETCARCIHVSTQNGDDEMIDFVSYKR
ncbi:UNVERIFIED_CONTAM: hypothetical protein NCL1_17430 [Trichonephila clavipes]